MNRAPERPFQIRCALNLNRLLIRFNWKMDSCHWPWQFFLQIIRTGKELFVCVGDVSTSLSIILTQLTNEQFATQQVFRKRQSIRSTSNKEIWKTFEQTKSCFSNWESQSWLEIQNSSLWLNVECSNMWTITAIWHLFTVPNSVYSWPPNT